jgi:hypothetical protein
MSIARLNEIQAAWMGLSGNAPEAEQRRVYTLMRELPRSYISIDGSTGEAVPMIHGQPTSIPLPLEDCKRSHPDLAALGFAWRAPEWVAI